MPLTRKLDISPSALSPTAGEVFFKQDIAVYTTVSFAAEMGVPEHCTDYAAMLERSDLDLIDIASPNRFSQRCSSPP